MISKICTHLFLVFAVTFSAYAKAPAESFEAQAKYNDVTHELVLIVTAQTKDVVVSQISIPRKWAVDAAIKSTNDFTVYVIPHDKDNAENVYATIERANKEVMIFRGRFLVPATTSGEIRFAAKVRPKDECRIAVSIDTPIGSDAKVVELK